MWGQVSRAEGMREPLRENRWTGSGQGNAYWDRARMMPSDGNWQVNTCSQITRILALT